MKKTVQKKKYGKDTEERGDFCGVANAAPLGLCAAHFICRQKLKARKAANTAGQ
ncbi:hypothetical protein [uncultured Pseudoflavonifractor sp.]|uniref:hypothetical protein n=1 Tax=uncultured Pseudoflavonifractor sp. TaxID=1221379 RepID=UPI0025F364F2|nr:hypothetical protein [uncultured Pseudoflavonifractor sp.]